MLYLHTLLMMEPRAVAANPPTAAADTLVVHYVANYEDADEAVAAVLDMAKALSISSPPATDVVRAFSMLLTKLRKLGSCKSRTIYEAISASGCCCCCCSPFEGTEVPMLLPPLL